MPVMHMMMALSISGGLFSDILMAVLIGLVAAAIVVGGMIRQMKTAVPKREANDYVKRGSLQLRVNKDQFLYKQTTRTARNRN